MTQESNDTTPVATLDCEPGDAVVLVPIPAPGLDAPDAIHGEVAEVTEHTIQIDGTRREHTTGATLTVDGDDGETYKRKRTGRLSRAVEERTRANDQTFWKRIAHDSELRREASEE